MFQDHSNHDLEADKARLKANAKHMESADGLSRIMAANGEWILGRMLGMSVVLILIGFFIFAAAGYFWQALAAMMSALALWAILKFRKLRREDISKARKYGQKK